MCYYIRMEPPQITINLGSVRMDKGEGRKYALAALKRAAARNPTYYCLDIICREEQDYDAHYLQEYMRPRIRKALPKAKIFLGVTTDFWKRPGAEALIMQLRKDGVPLEIFTNENNWQDINPKRETHWK